jgi:hypothetical protein
VGGVNLKTPLRVAASGGGGEETMIERSQIRQVITAQFYQSLAENGVQVQSIPQSELQGIINALADGVFAALAAVAEDVSSPVSNARQPAPVGAGDGSSAEEVLIWRGRPYLSIGTIYELTTQRIRIIRGILGNTIQEIELVRLKDSKVTQHMGERMLDIGDITIISEDAMTPEVVLHNVADPLQVREKIRTAMLAEKERRGVRYREDLS